MSFTHDQQKAIDLCGDSLLVSAAAGSGKTTVLTERVVKMLTTEPYVPVESLMILTFTTAAADEMRSRISKELRKKLENDRDNVNIRRQLSMLPTAQISTIHSACFAIVRENFEALGLDPMLSIADESQTELMKSDTLADFVDELYHTMDEDSDARLLIDAYYAGKNDRKLFTVIEKGSEFLAKLPFPELFDKKIDELDIKKKSLEILEHKLKDIISGYSRLTEYENEQVAQFLDSESEPIHLLYNTVREGDYQKAYDVSKQIVFKRFSKPKTLDSGAWKIVQSDRKQLKMLVEKELDMFLPAPEDIIDADHEKERNILHALFRVCTRFNSLLLQKRLKERSISYNDLEQFTLRLLTESYDGKTLIRSKTAEVLSEKYNEIIVDEYQDCNLIQELIFIALSKEGKNIFTVGDVKQSIYRFRDAQPQLFLDRQKNASYPEGDTLTKPSKIDLSCNFRSHPKVLRYINEIFYMLMTKEHSIDYTDGHELFPSDLYQNSDASSISMSLYVTSDSNKNTVTRIEAEAAAVAKKIKSIIGTLAVYDTKKNCERVVTASDIAIIMRAPKTCGALFELALEREGISCINNNPSEKYLDTKEVRDTLALLQAVDNPYDDVPLITAMHSEYFGFTANELASIRAEGKRLPFFDALKQHSETDKKSSDFLNTLTELRRLTLSQSVYGIIMSAYQKTSILTRLSLLEGGDKKRANLLLLAELASGFEQARYRGLFAFVTYLLKLIEKESDIPPSKLKNSPDCVNILSIHKSKGLEFPVVFFVNTTASISHEHNEVMYNTSLGAGTKLRDSERHCEFSSLTRNIIIERECQDDIDEYIRLLYVALTRAGSHLFISGALTAKSAHEMIISCDNITSPPTSTDTDVGATFFKWMLMPYIKTAGANSLRTFAGLLTTADPAPFTSEVVDIDAEIAAEDTETQKTDIASVYDYDEVMRLLSREVKTENIPAKLSVSEIKQSKTQKSSMSFKKPRFLSGGVTGADIGNATHKFLQFCDFYAISDADSFDLEKKRLTRDEFISSREADLVDRDGVITFMNSPLLKNLVSEYTLQKEERFMFTLQACEIMDTDSDEQVLIQGVLDCLFVNGSEAVIVDYKTDRVTNESELVDRYKTQLDMYARAVKQNRGLTTKACYIYSFALKKFIKL